MEILEPLFGTRHVESKWEVDEKSIEFLLMAENEGARAFAWKIPNRRRFMYLEDIPANYPRLLVMEVQSKKDLRAVKFNLELNGWLIVKNNL